MTSLLLLTALAVAPERFALVIGHNAPLRADDRALRYADDDALAMAALLREAQVDVRLLVSPDDDTRALAASNATGGVAASGRPTLAELEDHFGALNDAIRARQRRGLPSELLIYYSGHGDLENNEGVVSLADGRLTRSMLHDLLRRSGAVRNHVIIDACRSYFLAYARGPGGRRVPFDGPFAGAPASPTGFILSTSSDNESHEWTRYGGGVFSHEVRSGLRGAADVDGDGRVSYAELGAFLETANRSIPNPRFRPDFVVHAPDTFDAPVIAWGASRSGLVVDEPPGPMWVEGPLGERLVDLHPTARVSVRLPETRPLFVHRRHDTREQRIEGEGWSTLSMLPRTPVEIAERGALHRAFEALFEEPFGPRDVVAFRLSHAAPLELQATARPEGRPAWILPLTLASSGATLLGGGALTFAAMQQRQVPPGMSQRDLHARNATIEALNVGAVVLYVATAVGAGVATGLWLTDE